MACAKLIEGKDLARRLGPGYLDKQASSAARRFWKTD
jgi:hypothetical protein